VRLHAKQRPYELASLACRGRVKAARNAGCPILRVVCEGWDTRLFNARFCSSTRECSLTMPDMPALPCLRKKQTRLGETRAHS
jgi:hypothetical protein